MNILDTIVKAKFSEVASRKELYPVKFLEQSTWFSAPTVPLTRYLLRPDKSGIIAEFKRKSPSKGVINAHAPVERTTIGYMQAGASALSVLTDKEFFGGSSQDLTMARKFNFCPILRKDFVIDRYQIIEARSIGADAVLLIAAILEANQLRELTAFAQSLGLQVLIEVHTREELERTLDAGSELIGVNNRSLQTFDVSLATSAELAPLIPDAVVKVSESGIATVEDLKTLRSYGFRGFLMGEHFMRHSRPDLAAKAFIQQLNDGPEN